MVSESEKKMNALKRLFAIAPENIHTEVRFGNVRDEIIAMSTKRGLRRYSDWVKNAGNVVTSAGLKCGIRDPLCQNSSISCALNIMPHPPRSGECGIN